MSAARLLIPYETETPVRKSFDAETDHLVRLVHRRYERRLVERGLARPRVEDTTGTPADEDLDESAPTLAADHGHDGATAEDRAAVQDWLHGVTLVDLESGRQWPATALDEAFVRAWGGLAPATPPTEIPPAPESRVEVTVERAPSVSSSPPLSEAPSARPAVTSANDQGGAAMALTQKQQTVRDHLRAGLSATEIAERLGCSRQAVHVMKSYLNKRGHDVGPMAKTGPKGPRRAPAATVARPLDIELRVLPTRPAGEGGGGRTPDEELIAPIRARLAELDAKRAGLVAAIRALGGEA